MEQIFMLLAMETPEERLLNDLSIQIREYLETGCDKEKMQMTLGLLVAKYGNEGKSTAEAINDFSNAKSRHELFKPNNQ